LFSHVVCSDKLSFSNVGKNKEPTWLFCVLQDKKEALIHHGFRPGLPKNKPPLWVYCPLMAEQYPRDRKLICECKECPFYRGTVLRFSSENRILAWVKHKPILLKFSREELGRAEKESVKEEGQWMEAERKNGCLNVKG